MGGQCEGAASPEGRAGADRLEDDKCWHVQGMRVVARQRASELRRQRGVLERMAMRMMNVLTGKCLVAWQCQWSENKRLRRAATR